MSGQARILVLEDDELIQKNMRVWLEPLGMVMGFQEATSALTYAKSNTVDAAVIDIHLVGKGMDGIGFLRELRKFEHDLAYVIHTASNEMRIADAAIELKASRRVIKTKTNRREMEDFVRAAIEETRAARNRTIAEKGIAEAKTKMHEALGTYDVSLTAAQIVRGLIQGLRDSVSEQLGLGDLIAKEAAILAKGEANNSATLTSHVSRSKMGLERMFADLNGFLDGPFGDAANDRDASINSVLTALDKHFAGAGEWVNIGKVVSVRKLIDDLRIDCPPVLLINGLKHLAEYCLIRQRDTTELKIVAVCYDSPSAATSYSSKPVFMVNRARMDVNQPCVAIRFSGPINRCTDAEMRDILTGSNAWGRTANMGVVAQMVVEAKAALNIILGGPTGDTMSIDVLFPTARA